MVNLEIWSEELENENRNNDEISLYRICNKIEDDIRTGMLPASRVNPFSGTVAACGV